MKDVQNERPNIYMLLDKVGIKELKYPCFIKRKGGKVVEQVAEISIFATLPKRYRGTHMSRFLEILEEFYSKQEQFPKELEKFLRKVCDALGSQRAYLELKTPFVIEKISPISQKRNKLVFNLMMKGMYEKLPKSSNYTFLLGAEVWGNSTCPCSKEISRFGAHNQRVKSLVWINYKEEIWFEDLVELIENSFSSPLFSLLKREDEKFVTEKSYSNAKFVEDIAREIAFNLQKNEDIIGYKVEVESFESIHLHNAYACIKGNWKW